MHWPTRADEWVKSGGFGSPDERPLYLQDRRKSGRWTSFLNKLNAAALTICDASDRCLLLARSAHPR